MYHTFIFFRISDLFTNQFSVLLINDIISCVRSSTGYVSFYTSLSPHLHCPLSSLHSSTLWSQQLSPLFNELHELSKSRDPPVSGGEGARSLDSGTGWRSAYFTCLHKLKLYLPGKLTPYSSPNSVSVLTRFSGIFKRIKFISRWKLKIIIISETVV